MSTRFSVGQKDYITKLNELDDEFQAAIAASPTGLMNSHEAAADPHTQYAKKAGADFTGPVLATALSAQKSTAYGVSADADFIIGGTDNGYVDNGRASHWRMRVAGNANGQVISFAPFLRGTGWGSEVSSITPTGFQGAIGQTTPAAGMFTNVGADGNVTLIGAGSVRSFGFNMYGLNKWDMAIDGTVDADKLLFRLGGDTKVAMTATGIQGAIGQDTPAAGTFTNLFATSGNVRDFAVVGDVGAVAAGVASSGIAFQGDGIAHANMAWMPHEKMFVLRTGAGNRATTDYWGAVSLDVSGKVISSGGLEGTIGQTTPASARFTSSTVTFPHEVSIPATGYTITSYAGFVSKFSMETDINGTPYTDIEYEDGGLRFRMADGVIKASLSGAGNLTITGSSRAAAFTNAGALGTNAINARNHFTQVNAGNADIAGGWIAAAFGDTLGDRVVIGQASGKAIIGSHSGNLADWGGLTFYANEYTFAGPSAQLWGKFDGSGNLGLGVTPSAWSSGYTAIEGGGGGSGFVIASAESVFLAANTYRDGTQWVHKSANYAYLHGVSGNGPESGYQWWIAPGSTAGAPANFTQAMTLDASGNLGLGVTPSAWHSTIKAIDFSGGALLADSGGIGLAENTYYDGVWRYKTDGWASRTSIVSGVSSWFTAPSGTAGAPITWTQAMTLGADGNLQVGTTSNQARVTVKDTIATLSNAENSVCHIRTSDDGNTVIAPYFATGSMLRLQTNANGGGVVDRVVIDSSGNLLVGVVGGTNHVIARTVAENENVLSVYGIGGDGITVRRGNSSAYSGAGAALFVAANSVTSRSANLSGTLNASGADYAEYMRKAATCGTIAKGQIVGVNADGELTDQWVAAVSFLIKSTDPSYVGGDTWGSEEALGLVRPTDTEAEDYAEKLTTFNAALEAARAKVDRIAYAGQVPVNVYGASVGDYIVPVQDGEGIKGIAMGKADMGLSDYMAAVGIVQNILPDGRANVRVKVC